MHQIWHIHILGIRFSSLDFFEISDVAWQWLYVTCIHTYIINEWILVNETLFLRLDSGTPDPATYPLTHRQWGVRLQLNRGVKTPHLWPCPCVPAPVGWLARAGHLALLESESSCARGSVDWCPQRELASGQGPLLSRGITVMRVQWPHSLCQASREKVGSLVLVCSERGSWWPTHLLGCSLDSFVFKWRDQI